ncbi:C-type lectin domain family 4 member E-like [Scomber japonicus]|uniref:C-type lectin domain family 4 member E-like n=1 Tax=Scomber japonicus TaxID=13676 RepID=UPI002305A854|nr:C-type lectin domain family 4 member E-like [Scomber japonicus]
MWIKEDELCEIQADSVSTKYFQENRYKTFWIVKGHTVTPRLGKHASPIATKPRSSKMPEAEVLYSDVKFTRSKGDSNETTSSLADTTYSEVRIAKTKTEPSTELTAPQQVMSHEGSKVKSEKVPLLILCVLLAAVVIALCYVFTKGEFKALLTAFVLKTAHDNIQTKRSLKNLEDEYEALKKNLTGDSCLKCDEGWEQHLGKCYYFSITNSSWEKSRRKCQRLGGDLVKIDSSEEQKFLKDKLKNKMRNDEDKFWIGLTDSKEENKWIWVDGSLLNESLSFWSKTEPDNWNGTNPEGEDCARMGEKGGAEDLKCWFDRSCNMPHRSICEKPANTGSLQDVCV